MESAGKMHRRKFIQLAGMSAGAALAIGYLPGEGNTLSMVNLFDKDEMLSRR